MNRVGTSGERCLLATLVLLFVLVVSCGPSQRSPASASANKKGDFYALAVENRFEDSLSVDLARGKQLFERYCVICHGESGDGNGFNAYNLKSNFKVEPFDFTDSTTAATLTFESVRRAITLGGAGIGKSQYMPPWGKTLTDYDLNSVSSFVWAVVMDNRQKNRSHQTGG